MGEGVVSGVEHGVTIVVMKKTAQEYPRVVKTPQVARPSRDTGAMQKTEHRLEKDETTTPLGVGSPSDPHCLSHFGSSYQPHKQKSLRFKGY